MGKLSALKAAAQDSEERYVPPSASAELGRAMIEASLPSGLIARLKLGKGPRALILSPPTPDHAPFVGDGLKTIVAQSTCVITVLEDKPTSADHRAFAKALRDGNRVVAVCTNPSSLHASFRAIADDIVEVRAHDEAILRRAMRRVLGKRIPPFPYDFVLHHDPCELARCILPSFSPKQAVTAVHRLGSLQPAHAGEDELPPLQDCIEFGEAREWGLDVVRDIEAWRSGSLPVEDLDTCALLVSPPGRGKTLFSRILAAALGVPLFELTVGSLFVGDGHLGDVLKAIRKQFADAAAAAPCVLLLDELDSFSRRDAPDHNRSFVTAMVNELLTQLDGTAHRRPGLVVIGATNMSEVIDPALLRPGRLSRTIEIDLPDQAGVEHVLRVHLRKDLVDRSIRAVAILGVGRTPAELAQCVRSARQAARRSRRPLLASDLEAAIGGQLGHAQFQKRIALHEAGHALACLLLPNAPHLRSVTLAGLNGALGRIDWVDQSGAITRARLEAKIMVLLAGRAAEDLFHADDPSAGAASDISMATRLASQMHSKLGMRGRLASFDLPTGSPLVERSTAQAIEDDLQRLMGAVHALLESHRDHLLALTEALNAKKALNAEEAASIVEAIGHPVHSVVVAPTYPGDEAATHHTVPVQYGTMWEGA